MPPRERKPAGGRGRIEEIVPNPSEAETDGAFRRCGRYGLRPSISSRVARPDAERSLSARHHQPAAIAREARGDVLVRVVGESAQCAVRISQQPELEWRARPIEDAKEQRTLVQPGQPSP